MNRDKFERNVHPLSQTKPLAEPVEGAEATNGTDRFQKTPSAGLEAVQLPEAGQPTAPLPRTARLGEGRPQTDMLRRAYESAGAGARSETRQMTGPRMSPGALKALVEQTLAKAQPLATSLEPRVELLLHAFKTLNMSVPGVTFGEFKHELTPNTQKIVAYLVRVLQLKQDLARKMAVAVYRYQEAVTVLEKTKLAVEADDLPANALEELKLKFFYLTNYHEEFKGDPILIQLFPPPKNPVRKPLTGPIAMTNTGALKAQAQARAQALAQAEALWRSLGPKAEIMKLALSMTELSTARMLGAMFKPNERAAAGIARAIKGDATAIDQVRRGTLMAGQFQELFTQAKAGGDVEPMLAMMASIRQLASGWALHPVLKTVLSPKELAGPTRELPAPGADAGGPPPA